MKAKGYINRDLHVIFTFQREMNKNIRGKI